MGAQAGRRHDQNGAPGELQRRSGRLRRQELERENERLRRENEKLREKIDELERQLAAYKRNSTKPLQRKLFALAEAHLDHASRDVSNFATALFFNFDRLFVFLERDGVAPTHNVAERTLRTAVQWRKTSFGNRSAAGDLATARLLTVMQTCRMQQRHVLGYLTDAVRCHRSGLAPPSLLAP